MAGAAKLVATLMKFSDQFISKVVSHLIKRISRVLQKLLKYFNSAIISAFFCTIFACLTR